MTATLLPGVRTWGGSRDDEGHREFMVTHLVKTDSKDDGPFTVMLCPGLPLIGSEWNFGNDFDIWAFCWPTMKISIHQEKEGDPNYYWRVDQKFSTKPIPSKRCQDTPIEDPLLEPDRLSGSFVRYTEEATLDRFGNLIKSSSHEMFRGPQVEFDKSRQIIRIEQNRSSLEQDIIAPMQDTLNDAPLWGFNARCIKFNMPTWERKTYGICTYYFTRALEFEIRVNQDGSSGFDRDILDEGTKVLNGHWNDQGVWVLDNFGTQAPNKHNPNHFIAFTDKKGNPIRAILDGNGLPADQITEEPGTGTTTDVSGSSYNFHVEKYDESNFLLLGIPTSFS